MIRRPTHLAIASSLLLTLMLVRPAIADWPLSGISTTGGPFVSDNLGGVIVGASPAQRIDGLGVTQWSSGQCLSGGNIVANDAAPDGSGGVVLVVTTGNVFAGRVSAAGAVLWGSSGVLVCNATGNQSGPVLCGDGAGGAIMAWQDPRSGLDDIYAQRVSAGGLTPWAANGVPICTQPERQRDLAIIPDGSGGAIIAWGDPRAGESNQDIYAQRVDASGNPQWGADGIAVCTSSGTQAVPVLASDGVGGAIVSWWDQRSSSRDVYAQRLSPAGAALWAADGIPIANGPFDEYQTGIVADGAQGAYLVWEDYRSAGQSDIYAQRVNGTGSSLWTAGGVAVCTEPHAQSIPRLATDGAGGVVVSWMDARSELSTRDIRVQRLNSAGIAQWHADGVHVVSGIPAAQSTNRKLIPDGAGGVFVGASTVLQRVYSDGSLAWTVNYRTTWTGIFDEPADQGGWVQLRFNRAPAEAGFSPLVTAYSVWRRIPNAVTGPGGIDEDARGIVEKARIGPARMDSRLAVAADFPPGTWETFGSIPAMLVPSYVFAAPTHDDSTAAGPANDEFVIVSHTSTAGVSVASASASGHSVDNLPPLTPQNAAGTYTGPATAELRWDPNGERDLVGYAVYKGSSAGFVPSGANRLGTPTSPTWTDPTFDPGTSYYKISAADRHGNQSGYALIAPTQITAVGPGGIPAVSYVRRPQPNPARSAVTFEYGLARSGQVRMDILDVRGRLVRRILDRLEQAGSGSVTWEGTDETGRPAAPGIYWGHFVAPETRQTVRLVWLR